MPSEGATTGGASYRALPVAGGPGSSPAWHCVGSRPWSPLHLWEDCVKSKQVEQEG